MTDQPTEPPHAGNLQEWMRWAETKIALSLAVSLYFKHPPSIFAEGVLDCYRRYLELCEPHLRWYASENGEYRKASEKVLRIPFRRMSEALEQGKLWSWCAMGGEHHRHAAPYQFEASIDPTRPWALSFFRAAFAPEAFAGDLGRFVALVKDFGVSAPFFFGYAGFSFSNSLEISTRQRNEQYLAPAAMRFHGVEVEAPANTCLCCTNSIKGVNWLTLINSDLVARLGGKAMLRGDLSPGITLHDLPAGLLIQAGDAPGLGDTHEEDRLPLYREVHRALTPIRNPSHYMLGDRRLLQDETRRWMGRFDS
jgi:hypothetical protein